MWTGKTPILIYIELNILDFEVVSYTEFDAVLLMPMKGKWPASWRENLFKEPKWCFGVESII